LNVVLYRRKFKPYKYVVVGLVSAGISMFMLLSDSSKAKTKGLHDNSSYGLMLLGIKYVRTSLPGIIMLIEPLRTRSPPAY
jgi:UDP-galactose transporter B1